MPLSSSDPKTLSDLFNQAVQEVYAAETVTEEALPGIIDKVSASALKNALSKHLEETHGHVSRLERLFGMIGETPDSVNNCMIDGMVKDATRMSRHIDDARVRDEGLAASVLGVAHYEVARYRAVTSWASRLGHGDCVPLLEETLAEKTATCATLSQFLGCGSDRRGE
ncbi:DUF892 family protein [Paracoccus sp. TK19116]|uniref:DUF892 family protein n=1 Tax=Paracoccus albicereus TaxID=2922394 RepID=A0ABT1MQA8_9RHOB|nr:DUF892 family protein [Paracoccus albicereus]MCQ0970478.1 DUF892 family protein [Paracoccus albicereus]